MGKFVTVIEISTGQSKVATYCPTPAGHLRMNVDGKFYTDKQFNKLFKIVTDGTHKG